MKSTTIKKILRSFKTVSTVLLTASSLFLFSCDPDLLNTVPPTQVLTDSMWTTDNLTNQGMNGVYQALRLADPLYYYDQYGPLQRRSNQVLTNGTVNTASGLFQTVWQNLYEGVHRANNAVYGLTNVSPTGEVQKARYLAEAKFLRAFFYFRLNQLYKGVPIYLEPIESDNVLLPRNSEQEVWDQILLDLGDCIAEPNLPDRYLAGNSNYGRVGKSAAYALRGKVYMYLEQWDNAIADFEMVQSMGHTLFADYEQLFQDENEQAPEIIFSIQNTAILPVNTYGSNYQFFLGTRSAFGGNWNEIVANPDIVDLYQNVDGSNFNWNDIIPGYNEMTPAAREVFFMRNNATEAEIAAATSRGADMSLYLPTGNEARLTAAYANRDPRLTTNFILPYSTFIAMNELSPTLDQQLTLRWPYRTFQEPTADIRSDAITSCFYFVRKFVYEGGSVSVGIPHREAGEYDYIVIRYADVLLMWAEALNESGRTAEAVARMNEVKARAGVGLFNAAADQAAVREEVRDERRREFVAEGVSFFDEMRWQTLQEQIFYPGNGIKVAFGRVEASYTWVGNQLYTWPVPFNEIQRNPALTQNDGWVD